ncbi:MAG: formate dehydrogenase subunit gamma [Thermoanaerobaculaceae bacterium]
MHESSLIRRFSRWQVLQHSVLVICFIGLAFSGLPQKFPNTNWAKGLILLFGGVERARSLHHFLGTVMALQLLWHALELLWVHLVRRYPLTMLPRLKDLRDFLQQVRFNLGLAPEPPRQDRYGFAEKLEYLALIWGTVLMVFTGLILLYPVRWSSLISGEWIIALKVAHGGEAILAVLSILTWHSYFVHLRYFNRSMFTGYLEEEVFAEEHPLELERIRRGEVPSLAPVAVGRFLVFVVLAGLLVSGSFLLFVWLRWLGPSVSL